MKQPNGDNDNDSRNGGLRGPQNYSHAKERATACAFPDGLRACDERDDRIVETENTYLAENVSRRPGHGEYSQSCRSEQPRHKKCEDAAKIRRQHCNRVEERTAL